MTTEAEGWAYFENDKKWHYVRFPRTLCGEWIYYGEPTRLSAEDDWNPHESASDICAECLALRRPAGEGLVKGGT